MTETLVSAPRASSSRPGNRSWKKFRTNKTAMAGLYLVAFFIALALLAPLLPIPDPFAQDWKAVRQAPSWAHPFGTDEIGRDLLSRMIWGAKASLLVGVVSVAISVLIGVPIGLVSGYFGGWLDQVVSRMTEAFLAMPFLILAIALAAFLGPSLINAMLAIGLSAMPVFVRLTRGQTLAVKTEDYIEGARAIGLNHSRIIFNYLLPNILAPVVVQATLTIAAAIIAEASLSFLGLGQQPPAPSWGSMLSVAKNFLSYAPWMALWPGSRSSFSSWASTSWATGYAMPSTLAIHDGGVS